jgi:trans-2,3-dihydro-3-hydroxyanthranilate isomerase
MPHPLHVVDVFAEERWAGNPLAVVLDAGDLASDAMQAIARETNLSETTFVLAREARDGRFPVRIFTPAQEIPFAGHPTLGTAAVIRAELLGGEAARVELELEVGAVPVEFREDEDGALRAWLTAPPVALGAEVPPSAIAPALGLAERDLAAAAPARHVRVGIEFVFVPLAGLDALRRARLDLEAFAPLARQGLPHNVYAFCREPREAGHDLSARLLFDAGGVREDPATGSAAACLGAYLLEHALCGPGPLDLRIGQGHEIGRASLLRLRAREAGGARAIEVGGRVIPALRGELL